MVSPSITEDQWERVEQLSFVLSPAVQDVLVDSLVNQLSFIREEVERLIRVAPQSVFYVDCSFTPAVL